MNTDANWDDPERYEFNEKPRYRFSVSRRGFIQCVGAGLAIAVFTEHADGQESAETGAYLAGRFQVLPDGSIVTYTGKVEVGQGARTQILQAAKEELRVSRVRLVMGDTSLVPNDGGTYGSLTTPRTVPTVRQAAANARELLIAAMCKHLGVNRDGATMQDGTVVHPSGKKLSLEDFVKQVADINSSLEQTGPEGGLTPPADWKFMGKPALLPTSTDIVTGRHLFPSDIRKPDMLFGCVLRPPAYNAELESVDLKPAEAMEGVVVVRDGQFVGCAAPASYLARKAIEAIAATAKWQTKPHPSSKDLFRYLKENTRDGSGRSRSRVSEEGDVESALKSAQKRVQAAYEVPYIQHVPMETRAAAAVWENDTLTVWTGTQRPFDVRGELAEALSLAQEKVRVIGADSGGGFGGKHQGDAAIEAARLAQAAKRPVSLQWSREEEFMWAYCRPAALIEIEAALDPNGKLTAWDYINYNSGTSGLACPYSIPNKRERFQPCESPLRQGSYRALASTANNFARESFIDELAAAAGADPLEFRNRHLEPGRLKDVLNAAADRFRWKERRPAATNGDGCGIACGTEKGSFVATAVEVRIDADAKRYALTDVCVVFECGIVHNPLNLRSQVEGCVIMGLGAILREAIAFEDGKLINGNLRDYGVPRFEDVPPLDIHILERPDLPAVGAGETPIIGIAPAVANALYHANRVAQRVLPLKIA